MVKKFILFILLYTLAINAKADTIDYWHVKYNGKITAKYNMIPYDKTIVLKSIEIKTTDSIEVNYGADKWCRDCTTELILLDDKKRKHLLVTGKGTSNSLSFSLKDTIKIGGKSFDIYFQDAFGRYVYLFTIKIE